MKFTKRARPGLLGVPPVLFAGGSVRRIVRIAVGFRLHRNARAVGFYWHAHEMIWGHAGLVVVALPADRRRRRTGAAAHAGRRPGQLDYLLAGYLIAPLSQVRVRRQAAYSTLPVRRGVHGAVIRSQNQQLCYRVRAVRLGRHACGVPRPAAQRQPRRTLERITVGLGDGVGCIGLIGTRIISFFTSKRLNVRRFPVRNEWHRLSLWLPMLTAHLAGCARRDALAVGGFRVCSRRDLYRAGVPLDGIALLKPICGFCSSAICLPRLGLIAGRRVLFQAALKCSCASDRGRRVSAC